MAQGKMKVKSKLPDTVKNKKKVKGNAITQRANRPVKSKKKVEESRKLKQIITKTVNKCAEDEMRAMAAPHQNLSKAQEAVVKHHQKQASTSNPT